MINDDAQSADALLRENAELRAEVARLRAEMEACRERLDDNAPTLRDAVIAVERGQEELIAAYQENETRLHAELEAVRAVVAAMREIDRHVIGACENDFGDMPEPCEECGDMREIASQALAAYDKAVKASK